MCYNCITHFSETVDVHITWGFHQHTLDDQHYRFQSKSGIKVQISTAVSFKNCSL